MRVGANQLKADKRYHNITHNLISNTRAQQASNGRDIRAEFGAYADYASDLYLTSRQDGEYRPKKYHGRGVAPSLVNPSNKSYYMPAENAVQAASQYIESYAIRIWSAMRGGAFARTSSSGLARVTGTNSGLGRI